MKLTLTERRLLTQLLNGNWVYAYDHRDGKRGYMYASNLVKVTETGRTLVHKEVCVEKDGYLKVAPDVITHMLKSLGEK